MRSDAKALRSVVHHRLLADQVVEGLRAVLAREHDVGRGGDIRRRGLVVGAGGFLRHCVRSVRPGGRVRGNRRADAAEKRIEEADQRPMAGSLGLLPSGPDPVGERHVRSQLPQGGIWGETANMASGQGRGRFSADDDRRCLEISSKGDPQADETDATLPEPPRSFGLHPSGNPNRWRGALPASNIGSGPPHGGRNNIAATGPRT